MNNERGGIISKLFLIPAAIALMAGFFLLGYYVGQYRSKTAEPGENGSPLPELVSKNLPKPEDFTFYKTLTEKEDKTVSIELKPKAPVEEVKRAVPAVTPEASKDHAEASKNSKAAEKNKVEKSASAVDAPKAATVKQQPAHEKKTAKPKEATYSKLHYTIQVASYPEKQLAEDDVKKMKGRGYAAFIVATAVPNKGTWYRVRLGSFTNKAAAEKLARDVRAKVGISPIVTLE